VWERRDEEKEARDGKIWGTNPLVHITVVPPAARVLRRAAGSEVFRADPAAAVVVKPVTCLPKDGGLGFRVVAEPITCLPKDEGHASRLIHPKPLTLPPKMKAMCLV
jgi:hypothetical protein